jgi:rubrerythrin
MKKLFNSYKKVLKFAISQEVKAHQLYMDLSKKMLLPEVSELCKELAKEELEHKVRLEEESSKRGEFVTSLNSSKYRILYSNVNVFKNRIEMFTFAIKKEQASIQLYQDLAAVVTNEDSRQLFLWLAQQETEHKQRFGAEYRNCLK